MHEVDDKNGNVTERTSTRTEVGERFVTRSIDDEQSRNFVLLRAVLGEG